MFNNVLRIGNGIQRRSTRLSLQKWKDFVTRQFVEYTTMYSETLAYNKGQKVTSHTSQHLRENCWNHHNGEANVMASQHPSKAVDMKGGFLVEPDFSYFFPF